MIGAYFCLLENVFTDTKIKKKKHCKINSAQNPYSRRFDVILSSAFSVQRAALETLHAPGA